MNVVTSSCTLVFLVHFDFALSRFRVERMANTAAAWHVIARDQVGGRKRFAALKEEKKK